VVALEFFPSQVTGVSFLQDALHGESGTRDHATVAWGSAVTVITDSWWLNCKVDGTGVLLWDLRVADPFADNVAGSFPGIVNDLFAQAVADAGGSFPDWLLKLAQDQGDAPGCSDLVARA